MIGKLLGFKQSEFYLELDEKEDSSASSAVATTASVAPTPNPAAVADPLPAKAPKAKKAKSAKPVASKPPVAESTPVAASPAAVATASAPAPSTVEAEPSSPAKTGPEMTFSTDYLLTQSRASRRPGPSLNPFLAMAQEMKK